MIKQVIRLTRPGVFLPSFIMEAWPEEHIVVQPTYLSICAADQRYFFGNRPDELLRRKLPMALLHEAVGEVLFSPSAAFAVGDKVVLVPNVPGSGDGQYTANYRENSIFHSSNRDGFAQEFLALPADQLIKCPEQDERIYVFTEMMSVCVHAYTRWASRIQGRPAKSIGIWGDGALGYMLTLVFKAMEPEIEVVIFGKHDEKLVYFSFADNVINIRSKQKCRIDHAFECVGGEGAGPAIRDMIGRVHPEGTLGLLGVSEVDPAIHTRLVLEKGLTLMGSSRSSVEDFKLASKLIERPDVQDHLQKIISLETHVRTPGDLEQAFREDKGMPFKTVLHWEI